MNKAFPIVLLAGLGLGFVAGQFTGSNSVSVAGTSDASELRARIEALTKERDDWRQKAMDAAEGSARVAVPESKPESGRGRMGGRGGGMMGMGGARPTGDTDKKTVEPEPPDPDKAQRLLASVTAALSDGDGEALQKMTDDLAAQRELLVPDLISLLQGSESLFGKENLAQVLGEMGDPRAVPALQELLKSEDNDGVRTATVRALGNLPDESSVELLSREFGRPSTSPMPASLAATSLGNIASPAAVASLRSEIEKGSNPMVRAFAINALAAQKSKALVPFFVEQAQREGVSDRYRRSAIDAIVAAGDKQSVYQLRVIALSTKSSRAIQEAAKRAVNKLSGEKVFEVR